MKYDLEIVIPVSAKYRNRINDFKKYGIFNIKKRNVLVTLILSGEEIIDLKNDWPVDVNVVLNDSKEYCANLYSYFLNMKIQSRWIMKIDDDSCTNVDGIIEILDSFYNCEEKYYLACNLTKFGGPEIYLDFLYKKFFNNYYKNFSHEIECSIISYVALNEIQTNIKSKEFLKERCQLQGGATDVALAFASSMCKIYPVDFAFGTYRPDINNFCLFGGPLFHIHLISSNSDGENFDDRCAEPQYLAIKRSINQEFSILEQKVFGKKFLMETENELLVFTFNENRCLEIKWDERVYIWVEHEEKIKVFFNPKEIFISFEANENGDLVGEYIGGKKIYLKLIGFK